MTMLRVAVPVGAVFLAAFLPAVETRAADPAPAAPSDSAAVLQKLHHANQMEIEMGKLAQEKGESKGVKAFGKALVKDHTAADKKVMALAKQQKVELPETMPPMADDKMAKLKMASGAEFDRLFAQAMLEDHQKDVDECKTAHDAATDAKLKKLLASTIPVLEKHRDTAKKLVDSTAAAAATGTGTGATGQTPAAKK
jgi:putative membrane protein